MADKVDEVLVKAVKSARAGKPHKFAFIQKAPGGKLLLAKQLPPKNIAAAKKEVGSNTVFQGRCVGEQGILYFEVAKEAPPALPLQIKRVIKQDAGLAVDCLVRVKGDADEELEGEESESETPPVAPPAEPAAPGTNKMAVWTAAREAAVKDLRAIAAKVAATKDPDAAGVIIELQSIISNLTASPTSPQQVAELERYLTTDDVITVAEAVPKQFGTLKLREPLLKAVAALKA
jgi:hypothetical protein